MKKKDNAPAKSLSASAELSVPAIAARKVLTVPAVPARVKRNFDMVLQRLFTLILTNIQTFLRIRHWLQLWNSMQVLSGQEQMDVVIQYTLS